MSDYDWPPLTPPDCPRTLGGDPTGLPCLGVGAQHTHRFEASWAADKKTESEARDE